MLSHGCGRPREPCPLCDHDLIQALPKTGDWAIRTTCTVSCALCGNASTTTYCIVMTKKEHSAIFQKEWYMNCTLKEQKNIEAGCAVSCDVTFRDPTARNAALKFFVPWSVGRLFSGTSASWRMFSCLFPPIPTRLLNVTGNGELETSVRHESPGFFSMRTYRMRMQGLQDDRSSSGPTVVRPLSALREHISQEAIEPLTVNLIQPFSTMIGRVFRPPGQLRPRTRDGRVLMGPPSPPFAPGGYLRPASHMNAIRTLCTRLTGRQLEEPQMPSPAFSTTMEWRTPLHVTGDVRPIAEFIELPHPPGFGLNPDEVLLRCECEAQGIPLLSLDPPPCLGELDGHLSDEEDWELGPTTLHEVRRYLADIVVNEGPPLLVRETDVLRVQNEFQAAFDAGPPEVDPSAITPPPPPEPDPDIHLTRANEHPVDDADMQAKLNLAIHGPAVPTAGGTIIYGEERRDIGYCCFLAQAQHERESFEQVMNGELLDVMPRRTEVRATASGPVMGKPATFYANSPENLHDAIQCRVTDKQLPYKPTDEERADLDRLVARVMHDKFGVFSSQRIRAWANQHLGADLESLKSKKWSSERFNAVVKKMRERLDQGMRHEIHVKAEPMQKGKAPRIICSDKDEGQMMALVSISCLEGLMFEKHAEHCIKHKPKCKAMKDIVEGFKQPGKWPKLNMTATDGSAWDTCCSHPLRMQIEHKILTKISDELMSIGCVPETWLEAHNAANSKKQMKLFIKRGRAEMKLWIDSFRRSGHRGTSSLNFLVNVLMTLFVKLGWEEAARVFNTPTIRNVKMRDGTPAWFNYACDGDDMIYGSTTVTTKEQEDADSAMWERFGFRMKFNPDGSDKMLRFLGYMLQKEPKGGLGEVMIPELMRNLTNLHACTSKSGRASEDVGTSMLPGFVARAANFAEFLPCVSQKLLHMVMAKLGNRDEFMDREASIKAGCDEGESLKKVIARVIADLDLGTDRDMRTLTALGMETTEEELIRFVNAHWRCDGPVEDWSHSTPPSWV